MDQNIKIPFVDLYPQYEELQSEIDLAIRDIITRSDYITGPTVEKFEQAIMNYTGAEACASIGSGTNALVCALKALDIGPGHQVMTVGHTFVSTTEAIVNVGATPVFVDIDQFYHLDVNKMELTDTLKAILFVDLYGQTPDISRLKLISEKYNLKLIEDAAHSTGAEYNNKRVGGLVDLTCFSFNPIKNLGAIGDAGAVTGQQNLIDKVKILRDHGRIDHDNYVEIGYNARMDCIQASVLLEKIKFYLDWNNKKRIIASTYNNELKCVTPKIKKNCLHSFYAYVIQVPNRNLFRQHMMEKGIQTKIHYPTSINTHRPYYPFQQCVKSEWVCEQIVSLPCYYSMTQSEQSYVIQHINNWVRKYS